MVYRGGILDPSGAPNAAEEPLIPPFPMHRTNQFSIACQCLAALLLLSQVGCVALNIPSHRFHDPTDHGGLLGHWRTGGHGDPIGSGTTHSGGSIDNSIHTPHAIHADPCHQTAGFCLDGGPLEADPFDPTLDANGNPRKPEVPWPRFHPVPSRPVFGSVGP